MSDNSKTDKKDTFILRRGFYTQVRLLTREQRGDLLTALFAHAWDEELPPLDGITSMCFEFIRASVDSYSDRYRAKCRKNQENGRRGGRPTKEGDADDMPAPAGTPDGDAVDDTAPDVVVEDTDRIPDPETVLRLGAATAGAHSGCRVCESETVDCERAVSKPNESEKTERFSGKTNATEESERNADKPNRTECPSAEPNRTERFSEKATGIEKTERLKNNHDIDIDSDIDSDSDSDTESDYTSDRATHTRKVLPEGGVGETDLRRQQIAGRLLSWLEREHPAVQRMPEPLTAEQLAGLLRKYAVSDLQRLLAEMDNKRKTETNKSAYTTLTGFIRHDILLRDRQPQRYTWEGVLAYVDRFPGTTTDAFVRRVEEGRPVWYRKTDVQPLR